MAESYSVEAILSVKDKMSSAFGKAEKTASSFGGKLKSALGTGMAMGAGMKIIGAATNAMSRSLDGAISRYDTIQNFPKVMKNLGYSAKDAHKAINKISDSLDGLPTSTDAIVSSAQKIAPLTRDIGKATDIALAMNNALLAGGKSTATQANALEQYSQMLAAGKVDMQAWRSMMDAMPGQLDQLAVSLLGAGKNQADLYDAMKEGTVTFDDFNNALLQLNKKGVNGLASFEKQARASTQGIGTAIENIHNKVTKGMASLIESTNKALKKNKLPSIAKIINIAGGKIKDAFGSASEWIEGLDLSKVASTASTAFSMLGTAAQTAGQMIKSVAGFLIEHADLVAKIAVAVGIAVAAYQGFQMVSSIVTTIGSLATKFLTLAGSAAASVAPMGAAAAAETAAGNAARVSATGFMQMGIGLLAVGAGIALAAVGFALLTQSAIALASAGGPAIAVMAGMVVAIGGLIAVAGALGAALTAGAVGIVAFGASMLLIGAGVAVACAGISMLDGVIQAFGAAVTSIITAVSAAFTSFGSMIASIGAAVQGVLTAIASVFTSIGQAAISAGMGFQMIAMGIERLVALPMGDLAGTLATTAAGLKKIASAGQGLAAAAGAMAVIAAGISRISSSGTKAAAAINRLKATLTGLAASASSVGQAVGSRFSAGIASGMAKGAAVAKAAATAIVTSLQSASAKARASGAHAGQGFTHGFKSGLSPAVAVASSIMGKINAKFAAGVAKARSTGYNMGAGLASGMESAAGRCEAAAARIVAAAAKAANAAAKVHSPSRVTMKTGRMMALGLAVGLKKGTRRVQQAAIGLIGKIRSIMEVATEKHNFSDLASKAIDKFTNKLQKRTGKLEKKLSKSINKTFKKVSKQVKGKKLSKSLKGARKLINKKFTTAMRREMKAAIAIADEKLTELGDKYQAAYDEILNHKNTFYEKLTDYGKLYSSDSYGFMIFKDFKAATAQLEVLRANLKKLQGIGVSYDFLNEITQMDTASQIEYTNALLAKGADFAKKQSDEFDAMLKTATSISDEIYKPYIDELDANYNSELAKVMSDLEAQFNLIGQNAAQGLIDSLDNKKTKKKLKKVSKSLANQIIKQIKKTLKISSPSKVMASLGNYTGAGLAMGIDQMRHDVAVAADRLVQIPEVAVAGAYSGSLNSEYEYYGQAQYTVIVPVDLDGKEVARVTAPYMEDDLNKIQRRRDRRNGNL